MRAKRRSRKHSNVSHTFRNRQGSVSSQSGTPSTSSAPCRPLSAPPSRRNSKRVTHQSKNARAFKAKLRGAIPEASLPKARAFLNGEQPSLTSFFAASSLEHVEQSGESLACEGRIECSSVDRYLPGASPYEYERVVSASTRGGDVSMTERCSQLGATTRRLSAEQRSHCSEIRARLASLRGFRADEAPTTANAQCDDYETLSLELKLQLARRAPLLESRVLPSGRTIVGESSLRTRNVPVYRVSRGQNPVLQRCIPVSIIEPLLL